jgi:hypothetical protein
MKQEALDRTGWRTRFGIGHGPVVRQTAQWIHEILSLIAAKTPLFCIRHCYDLILLCVTSIWGST